MVWSRAPARINPRFGGRPSPGRLLLWTVEKLKPRETSFIAYLVAGEQLCGLRTSLPFFTFPFSDPLIGSLHSKNACGHRLHFYAMAPSRKTATTAEVALVPLKSCLVNLPTPVVSLLVNANAVRAHILRTDWTSTYTSFTLLGCPKRHCGTTVSTIKFAIYRSKVVVPRMDGHAEQAEAGASG